MKLIELRAAFYEKLTPIYGRHETESLFKLVLEYLHNMSAVQLALDPNFMLNNELQKKWQHITNRLLAEEPVQYITEQAYFYKRKFQVNPAVLIPRQETEELVQWIIMNHQAASKKVLDIGTGSGCIAVTLALHLQNAQVTALDVSEAALTTAEANATSLNANVQFKKIDILQTSCLHDSFDIIVSNPPYVRMLEKDEIQKNVLHHEPHIALFVEDSNALLFYEKIATLATKHLNLGGKLYFEINQYLGQETKSLLKNYFNHVILKKDIHGRDRMICAYS